MTKVSSGSAPASFELLQNDANDASKTTLTGPRIDRILA
jgi:hypothetical protein